MENGEPAHASLAGSAIRAFILLCNLSGISMDKIWGLHAKVISIHQVKSQYFQ